MRAAVQYEKQTAHFLRLVENGRETQLERAADNLILHADEIEALNGQNPYSSFLRKHRRRPDPHQAAAIGRIMGARVRASDGTMQPKLTRAERDAVKAIQTRRREWSQRMDSIYRTLAAIDALAENRDDPAIVAYCGREEFLNTDAREKLAIALAWLKRFSTEIETHEKTCSCPSGS